MTRGTLREQVNYWLGGIAPSLIRNNPKADRHAAEGTDPMWLLRKRADDLPRVAVDGRERWKIRCFGRLRIYRANSSQVDWGTASSVIRTGQMLRVDGSTGEVTILPDAA